MFLAVVGLSMVAVHLLRPILWWGVRIVAILDWFMWFLYNPFRVFVKGGKDVREGSLAKFSRLVYVILHYSMIAPAYKLAVYFETTPIRLATAIYMDFFVYLSRLLSDQIEELIDPRLNAMRFHSGAKYFVKWVVGTPKRAVFFISKFALGVVDAVIMVLASTAFPTFTMYHGTSEEHAANIMRERRWFVGHGNYAGTGVYFARHLKVAKDYSEGSRHNKPKVIVARVTFTFLQNCINLPQKTRQFVAAGGGTNGDSLAEQVKLPTCALEFWRNGTGTKWWEYVLLYPKKRGEFIRTWRIRTIGMIDLKKKTSGFTRLWGGNAHYCLSFINLGMSLVSAVICILLAAGFEFLFFQ
jgi:hypothetical protein